MGGFLPGAAGPRGLARGAAYLAVRGGRGRAAGPLARGGEHNPLALPLLRIERARRRARRAAAALPPALRADGRLFGLPGDGAAALLAGLLGGYPLGAAATAGLVERGALTPAEGARLLGFANNSGPAFLIGAAGAGVFGSVRAGLALYAAHVLAALSAGLVMRGRATALCQPCPRSPGPGPGPSRAR